MKEMMQQHSCARWGSLGLASVMLGLAMMPFFYLGIGAWQELSTVASATVFLAALVCLGFICLRLLPHGNPTWAGAPRLWWVEAAAWIILVYLGAMLTGMRLQTGFARFGSFALVWLVASAAMFPVVGCFFRRSVLVRRASAWRFSALATAVWLLIASNIATAFIFMPQRFV
ncbi:hypothetical protein QRO08_09395 [Paracidovorax citrulli]|nr:hypothetical protein [Paracidovorax citrulli]WIY31197.1 hypothetical protein QRO09_05605 [Paracidovorax citrulli]WIY40408.1 hypothetical protein QRO10_05545 [Paracidovorax citrulli]WIY42356.1 hypothetical protein QRO12_15475 [Paracidovorax citrulli]WIY50756.1 hypothetical protein QRO08_09395 [Paracidovorax citrulli]